MTEGSRRRRGWGCKTWCLIALAVFLFPWGCGLSGPPLVVVDSDTGKPLAGVRVSWQGSGRDLWDSISLVDTRVGEWSTKLHWYETDEHGRVDLPFCWPRPWWFFQTVNQGESTIFRSGWGVVRLRYGRSRLRLDGVLPDSRSLGGVHVMRRARALNTIGEWFDTSKVTVPIQRNDLIIPLMRLRTTEQWEEQLRSLDGLDQFPLELRAEELLQYAEVGGEVTEAIHRQVWSMCTAVPTRGDLIWGLFKVYRDYCNSHGGRACDPRNVERTRKEVADLLQQEGARGKEARP